MGFGGSTAWKMLEEGGKVVLTDIQDDLGNAAAKQMRGEGYDAIYSHLNVVDEANWSDVVGQTVDEVRAYRHLGEPCWCTGPRNVVSRLMSRNGVG